MDRSLRTHGHNTYFKGAVSDGFIEIRFTRIIDLRNTNTKKAVQRGLRVRAALSEIDNYGATIILDHTCCRKAFPCRVIPFALARPFKKKMSQVKQISNALIDDCTFLLTWYQAGDRHRTNPTCELSCHQTSVATRVSVLKQLTLLFATPIAFWFPSFVNKLRASSIE